jgi:GNAT superfamily N-acetyltransferase
MEFSYLHDLPAFLPELAQLQFAQWGYMRPEETLEERTARLAEQCLPLGMPTVLIAHEAGQLVGSAMLRAQDGILTGDLTPWLAALLVKPAYRERGIAEALMGRVEAIAVGMNFPSIHLCCVENLEAYYRKRGYETGDICMRGAAKVCVMSKTFLREKPC